MALMTVSCDLCEKQLCRRKHVDLVSRIKQEVEIANTQQDVDPLKKSGKIKKKQNKTGLLIN